MQESAHPIQDRVRHIKLRHPGEAFFFSFDVDDGDNVRIGAESRPFILKAVQNYEVEILLFQLLPIFYTLPELYFHLSIMQDMHR